MTEYKFITKRERVGKDKSDSEVEKWRNEHPDWISNHFYMDEFIYSAVAVERGLDNIPPEDVQSAIRNLVKKLLEPLRLYGGRPLPISSGYRCAKLNQIVGGVPNSQHTTGEAVDIYTFGSAFWWDQLIDSKLNFDQAIFYRRRNFMHLSLNRKGKNRRQFIVI